jgi:hypothetical protein
MSLYINLMYKLVAYFIELLIIIIFESKVRLNSSFMLKKIDSSLLFFKISSINKILIKKKIHGQSIMCLDLKKIIEIYSFQNSFKNF